MGLFLSYTRGSEGERLVKRVVEDWDAVREQLGGTVHLFVDSSGRKAAGPPRTLIQDKYRTGPWTDPGHKEEALDWLRARANDFVNVLRPRIRAAAADLELENR